MDNLTRATYRTLHSLRRKAAGEHDIPTEIIMLAFIEEWRLNKAQRALLLAAVIEQEAAIASKRQ